MLLAPVACDDDQSTAPDTGDPELVPAGGTLITHVDSPENGPIAVRVELPDTPRYPEGAPVVVHASTFFAGERTFHRHFDSPRVGAIAVSYLRPGVTDPETGASSSGTTDYGGPHHLAALRDVIRFACGVTPDTAGYTIGERLAVTALTTNVGLFASSHSGIVATNVLAHHGDQIPQLRYLVGRENPTRDEMYPLEIGHFTDTREQIENPHYHPDGYTPTTVEVDYAGLAWIDDGVTPHGRPDYVDGEGNPLGYLHPVICPKMWNRRYYSRALTAALVDSGVLDPQTNWPADLATPQQAREAWSERITVHNYPRIPAALSQLKVMLVFAAKDHVQAAPDKPHIRQAYDGFKGRAALPWVRLNPDRVYARAVNPAYGSEMPDTPANTAPGHWMNAEAYGFPGVTGDTKYEIPLAAIAEMADRVRSEDWRPDLDAVLYAYEAD